MHALSHPEAVLLLHVLLCCVSVVPFRCWDEYIYTSGTKYQYLLSDEMVVPPGLVLLNTFHHNT